MKLPASLRVPDEILSIARTLEQAGFETWCVGGAVRDTLLNIEDQDFDLATAARPADVQRLFRRTVPVGIEHGTVAVLDRHNQAHEVTTFRRDVKTDGRHAVVEFGATIEEDLSRRDFTINAIAYHPISHLWRDPADGSGDLERRVIRAVGDAAQRFREDYLRILRALRFSARLGFAIEPGTLAAARSAVEGLRQLSAERVRAEWFKGLETALTPSRLAEAWESIGASAIWLPEFIPFNGKTPAARYQIADRIAPRDPVVITAFLSARPADTLTRLRCSNIEIERGARIGEHRATTPKQIDTASIRRWMARVGPAVDDLVAIAVAEDGRNDLADAVRQVRESGAPLAIRELAINGDDLMRAGVAAGPRIGEVLRQLLDEVLEEPARNQRDYLLARALVSVASPEAR